MKSLLSLLTGSVVLFAVGLTAMAQENQPPEGKRPQPPREGKYPGDKPGGPPPEVREKFEQLMNVQKSLDEATRAAYNGSPELQAMRQEIVDAFEELAARVQAFDQKMDETIVKTSPDAETLVKEKRQLMAELEEQAGPKRPGLIVQRILRLLGSPGMPAKPGADRGGPPQK